MAPTENSQPIKVVAYARVSTGDQNLDNQLDEIKAEVERRGWKLTAVHTDIISGAKDTRPGLGELLCQVESGEVDVVIVGLRYWLWLAGSRSEQAGLRCCP